MKLSNIYHSVPEGVFGKMWEESSDHREARLHSLKEDLKKTGKQVGVYDIYMPKL